MTKKTVYAIVDAMIEGRDPLSVFELSHEDLCRMAKEDPARYNDLLIYS